MQGEPENKNPQNPDELMRIIAALPPDKRALFEIELTKRAAVSKAPVMQKKSAPSCVASIQAGQSGISIFCFLFSGGFQMEFFTFANLARLIGREHSFYGVIARGTDGISEPHHSVEEMASHYVQEITSIQPHGPYFLVGECLSAPVAYETARQLRTTGEEVGLLALLGARGRPHWIYRYVGTWLGAWLRYHFNSWSTSRLGGFLKRSTSVTTQHRSPRLRRAHQIYGLAVRRYRRLPYDGKIIVIANEEWYDSDPTLGWDVSERLEFHKIPGNHETYLRDHADVVAKVLRQSLQKALGLSPHVSP
jgi:surfactin synthase thioesterase subunit